MPNPNPCQRTRFKTERPESCTAPVTVKVPPSLKAKLKNVDGWQEEVRKFLEQIAEPKSA